MKQLSVKHTKLACYIGYITQAIVNNFMSLLFVYFSIHFDIPLGKVGLIVTINFATQFVVDYLATKYVDRVGYRLSIVLAHVFCAAGLILLGILPQVLSNPFLGLVIPVILCSVGGGLTEVIISPIVEAVSDGEEGSDMSLLHSFYCWGSFLVVALSTAFFHFVGIKYWYVLSILWALIPVFNTFYFMLVPIKPLVEEGLSMSILSLFKTPVFWLLAFMMIQAGASELAMSQWASAFAEKGLNVSKELGDLLGPCFFAICMGSSRVFHAVRGHKYDIKRYLVASAALCIAGYLVAGVSITPLEKYSFYSIIRLSGCGIVGFAVGAMWPGTFTIANKTLPRGGTAMFGLLALAGDLGCGTGPSVVNGVSQACAGNLSAGLLSAIVFPALLIILLLIMKRMPDNN